MKYASRLILLLAILVVSFSCSKDSEPTNTEEITSTELNAIIGEWSFVSEHSYYCSNDEIETERPADAEIVNTISFKEDGTYIEIEDNSLSQSGLWEQNEDGSYKIIQEENVYDDLRTFDVVIELDVENVMKWGVYGCEDNNSDTYIYAKYDRIQ